MRKSMKKSAQLSWEKAPEIKKALRNVLRILDLPHVKLSHIYCYRSYGSTSRSYARIWAFPKIFQDALSLEPAYVIEVLSKYYDTLSYDEQMKVLIHELLHIPKNFSGALLPHKTNGRHLEKLANELFAQYKRKKI